MESRPNAKRRIKPGKTISPRLTRQKAWAYDDRNIEEIFTLESSKKKINATDVTFGGKYPYVVRMSGNNGIRGFIDEDINFLNEGNTISFGQDTATVFYQEMPYFTGDKIKVLKCKHKLDRRISCYLVTALRKSFSGFSWGLTSFNENLLNKIKIRLPITSEGVIDYKFMETYIQKTEQIYIHEMRKAYIREMNTYLKATGFKDCELTNEENAIIKAFANKEFKSFKIGSLFNINTGRDVIIGRTKNGSIPLISHQHDNNGISKRIMRLNNRTLFEHSRTISLADRGVFYATTQIEDFHIGTRVKALDFKDGVHDENVRLFFVTSINKLQELFKDYLVNATDKLPSLEIKLPVTHSGSIDYKFMEVYIRAQKKLIIQHLKDWRQKEISATMEIANSNE